ncbi:MAG: hypothetical protein WD768_19850 [Phycisphaeraceae bacterium]
MNRSMQQLATSLLLAAALFTSGCKSDAGPSSAPTPTPEKRAALSPKEAVQSFRDVLRGEMVDTAIFLVDDLDYGSPAAEQTRGKIKALSHDVALGGYDFVGIDQKIEGNCAVVIVRESGLNRNGYNAIYLVHRSNRWSISPDVWSYDRFLGMDSAQLARFRELERWYQIRRGELRAATDPR